MLIEEPLSTDQPVKPQPPKVQKPPPIFIHGVLDYSKMIQSINEVAESEQFLTKCMTSNVAKINCKTPDTYRILVKHFKEKDIFFHTYQLKDERAYRVVLKYLHHTTDIEEIRQDLLEQGHVARNIVNANHRTTKEP